MLEAPNHTRSFPLSAWQRTLAPLCVALLAAGALVATGCGDSEPAAEPPEPSASRDHEHDVLPSRARDLDAEPDDAQPSARPADSERSDDAPPQEPAAPPTGGEFVEGAEINIVTLRRMSLPQLITIVERGEHEHRIMAANELGSRDEVTHEAFAALIGLLDEADPELQGAALYALAGAGFDREGRRELPPETADAINTAVLHFARELPPSAVYQPEYWPLGSALATLPDAERAVAELQAMLTGGDAAVRRKGAFLLGAIGQRAVAATPALIAALDDPDPLVRRAAGGALRDVVAEPAIPQLLALLQSESADLRRRGADLLGHLGPAAAEADVPLVELLNDADGDVRAAAVAALSRIEPDAERVRPLLVERLHSDRAEVRRGAVEALGYLRDGGAPAAAGVVAALDDEATAAAAVEALGRMGRAGYEAAPQSGPLVAAFLGDPDAELRETATTALVAMRPDSAESIAAVIEQLRSGDADTRRRAAVGLAAVGPAAQAAVPELLAALSAEDSDLRLEAARALSQIVPSDASAVEPLIAALQGDESRDLRALAAETLGRMGSTAEPALDALRAAMEEDPELLVQFAAEDAIEAITGMEIEREY